MKNISNISINIYRIKYLYIIHNLHFTINIYVGRQFSDDFRTHRTQKLSKPREENEMGVSDLIE